MISKIIAKVNSNFNIIVYRTNKAKRTGKGYNRRAY